VTPWYANESFWRELFPFLFDEARSAAAAGEIDRIFEAAAYSGREVLDLCCGAGRHSVELARRGFRVTGVDRSPYLLDRARSVADAAGVEVEWVAEDMRCFSRPAGFDLALNLFSSFGFFDDPEEDRRVLDRTFDNLRVGGSLVMELTDRDSLAGGFEPSVTETATDGATLVRHQEFVDGGSWLRNRWIVIREGRRSSFEFRQRVYSGGEIEDLLRGAGFSRVQLHTELGGRPLPLLTGGLMVVAVKL